MPYLNYALFRPILIPGNQMFFQDKADYLTNCIQEHLTGQFLHLVYHKTTPEDLLTVTIQN